MRTDITIEQVNEVIKTKTLITQQTKGKHSKELYVDFYQYFHIYIDDVLLIETPVQNLAIYKYNSIKL